MDGESTPGGRVLDLDVKDLGCGCFINKFHKVKYVSEGEKTR